MSPYPFLTYAGSLMRRFYDERVVKTHRRANLDTPRLHRRCDEIARGTHDAIVARLQVAHNAFDACSRTAREQNVASCTTKMSHLLVMRVPIPRNPSWQHQISIYFSELACFCTTRRPLLQMDSVRACIEEHFCTRATTSWAMPGGTWTSPREALRLAGRLQP